MIETVLIVAALTIGADYSVNKKVYPKTIEYKVKNEGCPKL